MKTVYFALNAVMPLVLLIGLGYLLKRIKLLSKDFLSVGNKLVFKLFLPITLFINIYSIEDFSVIQWDTVIFAEVGIVLAFLFGFMAAILFVKDEKKKGVITQCMFRSNYAIIGIPLAEMIAGEAGRQVASLLSAFTIPTFNILGVVALSVFVAKGGSGKERLKNTLSGIAKNPLIHGVLLGVVCVLLRPVLDGAGVSFRLSDVTMVFTPLSQLSKVTTPFSLLVLGGQFEFYSFKNDLKQIVFSTLARNLLIPGVFLLIACIFFEFSSGTVASFVAIFAAPVAVSSAIMAQEMGNDGDLARSLVVSTTVLSSLTLVCIIAVLRAVGAI